MKKRIACFLCFITLCSIAFSQNWSRKHFRKIDKWANQTPDEMAVAVPLLATYLTKDAETEEDKVRAIYIWIANHIHYDDSTFAQIDNFYVKEEGDSVDMQSPETVLKRRVALCEGYARLFKALCQQVGIRSEVVIGYCKEEGGALADIAHAWNVVAHTRHKVEFQRNSANRAVKFLGWLVGIVTNDSPACSLSQ